MPNEVIWNLCAFLPNEMEIYAVVIWKCVRTHAYIRIA